MHVEEGFDVVHAFSDGGTVQAMHEMKRIFFGLIVTFAAFTDVTSTVNFYVMISTLSDVTCTAFFDVTLTLTDNVTVESDVTIGFLLDVTFSDSEVKETYSCVQLLQKAEVLASTPFLGDEMGYAEGP